MKKKYLISSLSVCAVTACAFASVGLNAKNARAEDYVVGTEAVEVAGISVAQGDFQFDGVSLSYAAENKGENDALDVSKWTSGEGRLKYYTSMSNSLYEALQTKKSEDSNFVYKTGTLIIPEVLLSNGLTDLKVGVTDVADVDTTQYWTQKDDGYKTMAYLREIPRTYYTLDIAARSYLAVSSDGGDTFTYIYNATTDVNDCYSLTDIAQAKIDAETEVDGGSLTDVENTYCKFYVRLFDENKQLVRENKYALGDKIFDGVNVYGSSAEWKQEIYTPYRHVKGFYDSTGNYLANLDWYGCDDDSTTAGSLITCQGDMNLYAKATPANLVEDFDVASSVSACYVPTNVDENGDATDNAVNKLSQDTRAEWFETVTDGNGVTESGVVKMPCYLRTTDNGYGHFLFSSTFRDTKFFNDDAADYDNLVFRVMIKDTANALEKVKVGGPYLGNTKEIDTNTWVNVSIPKATVTSQNITQKLSASRANGWNVLTVDSSLSDEVKRGLVLYVDYVAYEKDVEISASSVFTGDEITLSTNLDENATFTYTVKDPDGENVTVTDGKFTPTVSGEYTVQAVTENYQLTGVDTVLSTVTQTGVYHARQSGATTITVVDRTLSVTLQTADGAEIDGTIESGTEVTVAAALAGADDATFTYVVENENQPNIVVENGKFTPQSVGSYNVSVACEYNGVEITKEATVNVTHKSNVIEDFATADTVAAIGTVGKDSVDRNTTNSTAEYDAEFAGRYGVVSAKPVAEADGTTQNYKGNNHNVFAITSQIRTSVEIRNMAAGEEGSWATSANKETYREKWFLEADWDYLSIWIYVDDETQSSTLEEIYMMGRNSCASQAVPLNEWYEFKIDKQFLFGSYDKDVANFNAGNYGLIQFLYGATQTEADLKQTQNCRVYFDSISLEKYDGEQAFTKVTVTDTATDSEVTSLASNGAYKVQLFVGETALTGSAVTVVGRGSTKVTSWKATTDGFTFTFTGTAAGYDTGFYATFTYHDETSGITYRSRVLMKIVS